MKKRFVYYSSITYVDTNNTTTNNTHDQKKEPPKSKPKKKQQKKDKFSRDEIEIEMENASMFGLMRENGYGYSNEYYPLYDIY